MNIEKIQKDLLAFSAERDWDQFHSLKNLVMALSVESSELVEIFQWLTPEESERVGQDEKISERVKDEVADVLIYLLRISKKLDIDLELAVANKMKKNADKYPVELAKGSSKKYSDLG